MDMYTSKPGHKFPFGHWTVGSRGSDPFCSSAWLAETPAELVCQLAADGAGEYPDVQAAGDAAIRWIGSTQSNDENTRSYDGLDPVLKQPFPVLRSNFHQLGGL